MNSKRKGTPPRPGTNSTRVSKVVDPFVLPTDVKAGKRSHLTNDELRLGLLSWSQGQVADFLISMVGWDIDRRLLELVVIAQADIQHSVSGLRQQMRLLVTVDEVKWNQVHDFIARLERALVAIRSVGRDHPQVASDLAWEYLPLIMRVADAVSGENELAEFYDDVVAAAHELAVSAGVSSVDRAKRLIDAFVAGIGYGMGESAIKLVKSLALDDAQFPELANYVRSKICTVSPLYRKELEDLAEHLTD